MTKRKRTVARILPAMGCLTVIGLLVAVGFVVAPRVRSLFTSSVSDMYGVPYYGPSQPMQVQRGNVSEGVSAYGQVKAAREAKLAFEVAGGEVAVANVSVGMPVMAGQVLVELDRKALERDLASARAELLEARQELEKLEAGATASERLRLEVELSAARQKLDEARRALADSGAGVGTPAARRARLAQDLATARSELEILVNDRDRIEQIEYLQWIYNQAEVKHGEMIAIPNPSEQDYDVTWLLRIDMLDKREALEQARMAYESAKRDAQYRVDSAARALAELDAQIALGLAEVERAKLVSDVRQAEAAVASFEEQLASLETGVADAELAEARAEVLKAEGAVADAERALENATLVAPFDGVITEGQVVVGQRVTAGTALVTVEDASSLQVVAQVGEIEISKVSPGMEVRVSFDAMMGQPPLAGHVDSIPLYGTFQNGMTVFELPIVFDSGQQLPLFQGMSANVVFPTATKEDVIVVPAAAVLTDDQGDYVLLVGDGGQPQKHYVTKGISDGIYTEIVEGLSEGDTVNVPMVGPRGPGGMMFYGGMY